MAMNKIRDRSARIIHNDEVSPGYFRLGLDWGRPRKDVEIRPGHFVMLRVSDGLDPLLRRPLGVYDASYAGLELLYRVVGRGTAMLSHRREGESLDVLGPLGNCFPVLAGDAAKDAVLLAGGMGMVPLYMMAKRLGAGTLLFGCRTRDELKLLKDFRKTGVKMKIATEDGSAGKKGLVTEILKDELTPYSVVFACGPAGMLKAASRIADSAGAVCYVSLERAMACGIGVCLGCAVKTVSHNTALNRDYSMVCSDGPVFDARDIDWDLF